MELPSSHLQEMSINLTAGEAADGEKTNPRPQPEEAPKCPRCDSGNTKFCYYNNYSLSQPRYFCKACRRYWTKGGTLRNVPIGGGCRKNKRSAKRGLIESHLSHLLLAENVLSSSSSFSSPLTSYDELNSGTSKSLSMAFARLQKQSDGDANLGFGFGYGFGHHQPTRSNLGLVNNFSTSDHQSLYNYNGFENSHHTQPLLPCEDLMSWSLKLELSKITGVNDNMILRGYPWQMEKVNNGGLLTLENSNNNLVIGSNNIINVGNGCDEVGAGGRESWNSGGSALADTAPSWPNLVNTLM